MGETLLTEGKDKPFMALVFAAPARLPSSERSVHRAHIIIFNGLRASGGKRQSFKLC